MQTAAAAALFHNVASLSSLHPEDFSDDVTMTTHVELIRLNAIMTVSPDTRKALAITLDEKHQKARRQERQRLTLFDLLNSTATPREWSLRPILILAL